MTETQSPVTRWRKRPVTVEAVQWTGDNADQVYELTGCQNFDVLDEQDRQNCDDPDATATVFDQTHNTWLLVTPGQWVVKGVQGELYPCSGDIFEATYEPAVIDSVSPGEAFRTALHERWAARNRLIDKRPWDSLPETDRYDLEFAARDAIAVSGLPEAVSLLVRLLNGVVMEAGPEAAAAARNEAEELLTAIAQEEDFLTASGQSARGADVTVIARWLDGPARDPEIRMHPCPVETHDGEHVQVRTRDQWMCGHLLARVLAANGIPSPLAGDRDRLAGELAELREELAGAEHEAGECRRMVTAANGDANVLRAENAQLRAQQAAAGDAGTLRDERDEARAVAAEVLEEFAERMRFDRAPATEARITAWRERIAGAPPSDLRPHEHGPGWHEVTCGSCGEEFGTNFGVSQIGCPECEARRCPNCRTWFGGES